jgi:hypothetical protein
MSIQSYLARYGKDKRRLLEWVSKNNGSPAVALTIIKDWTKKNKEFYNPSTLDRHLLQLSHSQQTVDDEVFHQKMKDDLLKVIADYDKEKWQVIDEFYSSLTFWGKIKWLLTRQR